MSWLHYLIEANIYLLIFYVCYRLLFAKNTHYTLSRVYLISTCVIAFVIPLTQVSALKPHLEETQTFTQSSYVLSSTLNIPVQKQGYEFTVDNTLPYLYIAGTMIAAVVFVVRLWRLFKITKAGRSYSYGDYQRVDLPDSQTAFSFCNYLYMGTGLKQSETIIAHELVHIRQKHTLDVLFLELLKIVNWFSPVVYLVQQSLKTLHEYIADEQTAARENDALSYSSFLLNNAYGLAGASVTHSFFNNNLLKRRIIMLNQKRSGKLARLKYLAAVPLCAGMMCTSTLLFSKDYGVIDLGADKKPLVANNDSAMYRLKVTDLRNGLSVISDKMEYTDPKTGEKTTYTVKNFEQAKQQLLKRQNFLVEKVLRDSSKILPKQTQQLPPPPPPLPRVETPFSNFVEYLKSTVMYPGDAVKNKVTGGVILNFKVNNAGNVTDATVDGKSGSKLNQALKTAVDNFKGKIKTTAGNYKLGVNFTVLGKDGVNFPKPSNTKEPNYIGEIQILGLTDAQHRLLNTPPPPPPPVEPRKKSKGIPPSPPPPSVTSTKWKSHDQSEGLNAFYSFIAKYVRFPAVMRNEDKSGVVIMNFDVKDGKLNNIKLYKGILPIADNEVARVLGMYDKRLDVPAGNYYIPVSFNLVDEDNPNPTIDNKVEIARQIPKDGKSTILTEVVVTGSKIKS